MSAHFGAPRRAAYAGRSRFHRFRAARAAEPSPAMWSAEAASQARASSIGPAFGLSSARRYEPSGRSKWAGGASKRWLGLVIVGLRSGRAPDEAGAGR